MSLFVTLLSSWRLLLGVALAAALWWQTDALERSQRAFSDHLQQDQAAQLQAQAKAAQRGVEAVTAYVDQNREQAPAVERVRTRIIRQCLREPAAGVQVPAPAGDPDAAAGGAAVAEDRAIVEAAAADVGTCAAELNRFRSLQEWVHDVARLGG